MDGNASSTLTATNMSCVDTGGFGVAVVNQGTVRLDSCDLTGNRNGSMQVEEGCVMSHVRCNLGA